MAVEVNVEVLLNPADPVVDIADEVKESAPPVAAFVDIEAISFDVAGVSVVPDLLQYPTVPVEAPVIFPEQAKLPFELVMVQPVAEFPPAILTSIDPSACKFNPVDCALIFKAPAEFVIEAVVVEVRSKVPDAPSPKLI